MLNSLEGSFNEPEIVKLLLKSNFILKYTTEMKWKNYIIKYTN